MPKAIEEDSRCNFKDSGHKKAPGATAVLRFVF